MSRYVQICTNMSSYVQIRPDISRYFKNFQKFRIIQNISKIQDNSRYSKIFKKFRIIKVHSQRWKDYCYICFVASGRPVDLVNISKLCYQIINPLTTIGCKNTFLTDTWLSSTISVAENGYLFFIFYILISQMKR